MNEKPNPLLRLDFIVNKEDRKEKANLGKQEINDLSGQDALNPSIEAGLSGPVLTNLRPSESTLPPLNSPECQACAAEISNNLADPDNINILSFEYSNDNQNALEVLVNKENEYTYVATNKHDNMDNSIYNVRNHVPRFESNRVQGNKIAKRSDFERIKLNTTSKSKENINQKKYSIVKESIPSNGYKRSLNESDSESDTKENEEKECIRCQWEACSAEFESTDELIPHISTNHVGGRKSDSNCKWETCNSLKNNHDDLLSHLYRDHLGFKRVKLTCLWNNCKSQYSSFDELTAHLSELHVGSGRSEYVCYWKQCDRLGKPFTQRQKVMRHLQVHTGDKPYMCNLCERRFAQANVMTQHLRTHTGEKPYKCSEPKCAKSFSIPWALNYHLRTHNGEKPFACQYQECNKMFSNSSNLSKHEKTHTGEKPFECKVDPNCKKRFARLDHVKRHMKIHNNGDTTSHHDNAN